MPAHGEGSGNARHLSDQLDQLAAAGCCPPGDMIVFPISANSGSLAELAKDPAVTIERVGPDVVRIRRAA